MFILGMHRSGTSLIAKAVRLNETALEQGLSRYSKYFFGPEWERKIETDAVWRESKGKGLLDIAVCPGQERIELLFKATSARVDLTVQCDAVQEAHGLRLEPGATHTLSLHFGV